MAYSDWTAEVVSISPVPNRNLNPVTGEMIDPDGKQTSDVVMILTNKSSGLVQKLGDRFSFLTAARLANYVQGRIDVIESGEAAQKGDSDLLGPLEIAPVETVETPAQLSLRAYITANNAYNQTKNLTDGMTIPAGKQLGITTRLDALKASKDAASLPVIDAIIAGQL